MSTRKVKVAIIGAGTAGLTARREVEKLTDDYVVIDDGILGTTCARVGCMPSKVLIQVANDFHRRKVYAQEGILGSENLSLDPVKVMEHVRSLRDRFVRGVMKGMENWQGNHFIAKRARFIDENTLDLGDEKVIADKIIIATGSSPIFPGPWKAFSKYFIDTDAFFEQKTFPQKIAVIGLGVIGIELGQALHRLGFDVVGIGKGLSIGGITDPVLQSYVQKKLSEEMKLSFEGVTEVSEQDGKLLLKTPEGDHLVDQALLAMGRKPNLSNLGLESLNLKLDQRGIPIFDKNTLQIPGHSIFIAGDVNGERPILHEASDQGRIAGYNVLRDTPQCFQQRTSLGITFSSPNIATVGLKHQELLEQGFDFAVGEVSFEGQGRSIVMLSEKGLMRIYGEKGTGRLLGAEMFAPAGEHMAHLIAWAISMGMTAQQVLAMPFYHPVVEEGLRTAIRGLAKTSAAPKNALEVLRCQDHLIR
ncbi:MAG: dihydrolipoyl dehydrogenase [Bdellovibrionales bacterium]|nr:dihydrolipoyl dehydrogenase [Bdellovibrionales bacterium]